ncbi:unnamed protein product [Schistosoma mattheei]|uniref:Uncharacterized protein n=1 Tax=Schistosoma mattheei TaxID=31246 RepID=A0A183PZ51_9TREM|nr:unnamed protein product [Schistosoma mattheei]
MNKHRRCISWPHTLYESIPKICFNEYKHSMITTNRINNSNELKQKTLNSLPVTLNSNTNIMDSFISTTNTSTKLNEVKCSMNEMIFI